MSPARGGRGRGKVRDPTYGSIIVHLRAADEPEAADAIRALVKARVEDAQDRVRERKLFKLKLAQARQHAKKTRAMVVALEARIIEILHTDDAAKDP